MWDGVRSFSVAARSAETVGQLNAAFHELAHGWGFDAFAAIQVSSRQQDLRQPIARSFGRPKPNWIDQYRAAGHVRHDPTIPLVMQSIEPYWWGDVEARSRTREERLVFDEAREFGMHHGLGVPVRLADGSVWSCVMAARHVERSEEVTIAAVTAASLYVGRGAVLQSREIQAIRMSYLLTPRQREVVTWLARGLSTDEIGEVLRTSGKTVSNHVEASKRRLGVRTQAGLVAEALLRGEILLEDVPKQP